MTKVVNRIPQWAIFRGDKIVEQGYYESEIVAEVGK
jgi:hypothetical protein